MERVAIVGPGGAGKSTFARALADRTGLPVIHLDRHFWKPGWVETERDAWRQEQAALLAGDRWIVDGNYGGTLDERFSRADTVIVIARHRIKCVASAVWRSTRNDGKAVQADGCPERLQLSFFRWIWNYPRDSRPTTR
ncbi:MAG: isopentenyl transferase family protein [Acidimicrobiales bacterium]